MPSINRLQPIRSCDCVSGYRRWVLLPTISFIVIAPLPFVYRTRQFCNPSSVPIFFIQMSKNSIVQSNVSTPPSSWHSNTCAQDSMHRVQLGHLRSWFGQYLDWYRFVPATSITCLHAHIWNIRGSSWSAEYTISQSTSLNWSGRRIFWFLNTSSASCVWTQKHILDPVSDYIFSFPRNTHNDSNGNAS